MWIFHAHMAQAMIWLLIHESKDTFCKVFFFLWAHSWNLRGIYFVLTSIPIIQSGHNFVQTIARCHDLCKAVTCLVNFASISNPDFTRFVLWAHKPLQSGTHWDQSRWPKYAWIFNLLRPSQHVCHLRKFRGLEKHVRFSWDLIAQL